MTDGDAPILQSVTQGDSSPDPILAALERKQRQLQDIATTDELMTPERRRSLERQVKDLKDLARYHLDLAQLAEEIQAMRQNRKVIRSHSLRPTPR